MVIKKIVPRIKGIYPIISFGRIKREKEVPMSLSAKIRAYETVCEKDIKNDSRALLIPINFSR